MTVASTTEKHVPALDETSFQQLLAAAYVVQQHNDSLRAKEARLESSNVLAHIAEIQSLARTCSLDVTGVAALAADRLRKMTDAAGVSIGIVTDGYLDCVAESGVPAKIPGSSLASHSIVATERLKSGELFESDDAQNDIRLDVALCRELKTASLIAAPVHRYGELSGLVELRWNRAKAFQKGDSRACRMIAGLMTTTLERSARQETTPPVLPEAVSAPAATPKADAAEEENPAVADPSQAQHLEESLPERCRVCGQAFGAEESFCGNCSMPRIAAGPANGLQSKWASMWYMQQAHDVRQVREVPSRSQAKWLVSTETTGRHEQTTDTSSPDVPSQPEPARSLWTVSSDSVPGTQPSHNSQREATPMAVNLQALTEDDETEVGISRWRRHSVLLLASLAVFLILTVWGFSPASDNAHITRFESLLVQLGLAEASTRPVIATGRPEARVWIDVHTALYYCEGSDLYGKTPEGRFSTQREAQQDQFEPATQAPCR